jgi:uncharacterized protein YndB with AHSA1/START domain
MAHISTSVEIARSPEEVFAFISDVSRHPEWQPGLISTAVQTEGPLQVGSRVVHKRKIGPTTFTATSEVTEFDPPHVVAFRDLDGALRGDGRERVEPVDQGSRVSFDMEVRGHGLLGVLMLPMVRRQVTRQVVESHKKLKLMLEAR